MSLTGFRPGETKPFSILLKINGVAQDVSGDAVTFRMKTSRDDTDAASVVSKAADVATRGASGYADFELEPSDTDPVTSGSYYCDIEWVRATGEEFIAYSGRITVFPRVSDA